MDPTPQRAVKSEPGAGDRTAAGSRERETESGS